MLLRMNYPLPLAILDTETTGLDPRGDRIIEIGIIRVENGSETRRFNALINPECALPAIITEITGITDNMLVSAQKFESIAEEVSDILDGAIFVAHNAPFDLGFVRSELSRAGKNFDGKSLCTVRLSRNLYPEHRRHDLASIIERYGFNAGTRHRAEDDANVVWQFLRHSAQHAPKPRFDAALRASML